jgi:hypothetical protein
MPRRRLALSTLRKAAAAQKKKKREPIRCKSVGIYSKPGTITTRENFIDGVVEPGK